ncbi:type I-E CRISPR-associated protein Cas6/Cse3/CasE [Amycolatopsis sp. NPDC059657]|uniref:type I-E CRISPR-associated protein Cas6/Cse3/CasE n=1 Tax=Amycolatopsis sp. NPDC059657 TaxID=3346899 RepID=UPI003672137B
MHLTRFEINAARRDARFLLASPQRMHAAVLASFPPAQREATEHGRVLWRVDERGNHTVLYLVSPFIPDLTHLVEQAGWPTTSTWQTRPYAPLLDRLERGSRWSFRLTANPVHSKRKSDAAERSQRFGHVTVRQQEAWLLERCERNGFVIPDGFGKEPDVAVHGRRIWRFDRGKNTVTLATATFEGTLEISDAALFRRTLTHGIGAAKGYGCGLLTLAAAT